LCDEWASHGKTNLWGVAPETMRDAVTVGND
jgi:hypothetical protein